VLEQLVLHPHVLDVLQLQHVLSAGSSDIASSASETSWISNVSASSRCNSVARDTIVVRPFRL
jgi:hypothetical protein